MTKELPVTFPKVSVYPKHAIPLSILNNSEKSNAWFYSNYIQLKCSTTFLERTPADAFDYYTLYPEFYENPYLYSERLSIDTIYFLKEDIIDFLEKMISDGYYLYTHVDEFFIPDTNAYNNYHFPHAILIYGYDKSAKIFNIAGFDKIKFSFRKCEYRCIQDAFQSIYENVHVVNHLQKDYFKFTYMLKIKEENGYELDIEWISDQIEDYLNSQNSSRRFRGFSNKTSDYYGVSIYGKLLMYYKDTINSSKKFDLRPMYLVSEHKTIMLERLKYLKNNLKSPQIDNMITDYEKIVSNLRINLNLCIKYSVNNTFDLSNKLENSFSLIRTEEERILEKTHQILQI